jgi:hypothetical protein
MIEELLIEEQQITDAFMRDFEELLRRYNAYFEMEIGDYDARAMIDFRTTYDENHNIVRHYFNFQMPNYINPNR